MPHRLPPTSTPPPVATIAWLYQLWLWPTSVSAHDVSDVVGFASVPVMSVHVRPASTDFQNASVVSPPVEPTNAYNMTTAGSASMSAAIVVRPVPAVTGCVACVHVAP